MARTVKALARQIRLLSMQMGRAGTGYKDTERFQVRIAHKLPLAAGQGY